MEGGLAFVTLLSGAASVAAEQSRSLSRQIVESQNEGESEYEATYRAILYFELRSKIRFNEMSLETSFRDKEGKLVHADLTYCQGGIWEQKNDLETYVIEIAPVTDSKRGPSLRAHSKKKISRDLAKLESLSGLVGHRILIVPFIGSGQKPAELEDEESLKKVFGETQVHLIPC